MAILGSIQSCLQDLSRLQPPPSQVSTFMFFISYEINLVTANTLLDQSTLWRLHKLCNLSGNWQGLNNDCDLAAGPAATP